MNEMLELQEQIGESIAQVWLGLVLLFYCIQIGHFRQSKKLGDEERMKVVKKRMLWGIPGSIVLLFVLVVFLGGIII